MRICPDAGQCGRNWPSNCRRGTRSDAQVFRREWGCECQERLKVQAREDNAPPPRARATTRAVFKSSDRTEWNAPQRSIRSLRRRCTGRTWSVGEGDAKSSEQALARGWRLWAALDGLVGSFLFPASRPMGHRACRCRVGLACPRPAPAIWRARCDGRASSRISTARRRGTGRYKSL
jgi:hypothetical protein